MTETGKVAIVTGAGGDIGRAIVHGLREDGYAVLAADIDGAAAGRTAGDDAGITAFAVDITDAILCYSDGRGGAGARASGAFGQQCRAGRSRLHFRDVP